MKFNKQKVIKVLPFLMFGYFANKLYIFPLFVYIALIIQLRFKR